jgi:hypothetical protein
MVLIVDTTFSTSVCNANRWRTHFARTNMSTDIIISEIPAVATETFTTMKKNIVESNEAEEMDKLTEVKEKENPKLYNPMEVKTETDDVADEVFDDKHYELSRGDTKVQPVAYSEVNTLKPNKSPITEGSEHMDVDEPAKEKIEMSSRRMENWSRIIDGRQGDGKRKRKKKAKWMVPPSTRMETENTREGWKKGLRRIPKMISSRMKAMLLQMIGVACRRGEASLRKRTLRLEKARARKKEWLESSSRMDWTDNILIEKRRTRLERAEAKKKEWWTDHLQMDWMENEIAHNNISENISNTNIFEQKCGTTPPT